MQDFWKTKNEKFCLKILLKIKRTNSIIIFRYCSFIATRIQFIHVFIQESINQLYWLINFIDVFFVFLFCFDVCKQSDNQIRDITNQSNQPTTITVSYFETLIPYDDDDIDQKKKTQVLYMFFSVSFSFNKKINRKKQILSMMIMMVAV